jgi:hypothetical protein
VDYGLPITNSVTYPAGHPIAVQTGGGFVSAAPTITSVAGGVVTLSVPGQTAPSEGYFVLTGVLLDLTSWSSFNSVAANVSIDPASGVTLGAGQTQPVVVTTVLEGLTRPRLTPSTTAGNLSAAGIVTSGAWSIDIAENYIDMFRSAAQYNSYLSVVGSTNAVRLALRFTGIPAGVTLGGCSVAAMANGAPSPGAPFIVGGATTISAASNNVLIDWGGDPLYVAIETLTFSCTSITVGPSTSLPMAPGYIGVQATLSPTGTAFGSGGAILTDPDSGQIPRFAESWLPTTPLVIVTITGPTLTINKQGIGAGTVTSDTGINCGVTFVTCVSNLPINTTVTLTASPDSSSIFGGWSGDCPGTGAPLGACVIVMNGPKTATATFNPTALTLSYVIPGSLAAGSSQGVGIYGFNFVKGTNVLVSGAGITVSSVFVNDSTHISAVFTVAPDAAPGVHTVTLATPTQTSGPFAFSVTVAQPTSPVTCSLSSVPVPRATATGQAERVGDVTLNCTANTNATVLGATVVVQYGTTITNGYFGTPQQVQLTNATGFFNSAPPGFALSNLYGQIQLQIPSVSLQPNDTGSITINGVEVSLNGMGKASLDVTAWVNPGSSPFSMQPNVNTAVAIGQILQGLSDPAISPAAGGTARLSTSGTVTDSTFGLTIEEDYIDMFRSAAQYDAQRATNATQILLTFNGIPPGVVLGGCSVAATVDGNPSPGLPVLVGGRTTISSASNQLVIDWNGSPDLTALETVIFKCTSIDTGGAALPLARGSVTVTATLAPDGIALNPNGSPLFGPAVQIPRYSPSTVPISPLVLLTIGESRPGGQVTSQD